MCFLDFLKVIELSSYLEKRIAGTAESADKAVSEYNEIGKVVTVGDGIARVYGLNNVQAGEVSAPLVWFDWLFV